MPFLKVHRAKTTNSVFRKMKIHIDQEVTFKLRPGETRSIELGPGAHEVFASMDWVRSKIMVIDDSDGYVTLVASMPGIDMSASNVLLGSALDNKSVIHLDIE